VALNKKFANVLANRPWAWIGLAHLPSLYFFLISTPRPSFRTPRRPHQQFLNCGDTPQWLPPLFWVSRPVPAPARPQQSQRSTRARVFH
jgi:hypothetical protein